MVPVTRTTMSTDTVPNIIPASSPGCARSQPQPQPLTYLP